MSNHNQPKPSPGKMPGDGITTCWVCGGPLDLEGRCLVIGAFAHNDGQSDYFPELRGD
jgi:hypothetical protein